MIKLKTLLAMSALAIAVQMLPIQAANAGRTCDDKPMTAQEITRSLTLAEKTRQQLEQQYEKDKTEVVILGRIGQDLSQYNQRYSHIGIAYRLPPSKDNLATWRVVHKLNECNATTASLYKQGLGEFFLDSLYEFEAGWVNLKPILQKQVLATINDGKALTQLHEPQYNMVAYPWSFQYQQSNQWVIEVLAHAEQNNQSLATRAQSQAVLKTLGYTPATLNIGPLTRLGGSMRGNVKFDDHPNSRRFANNIDTITADSVFRWLMRSGLGVKLMSVGERSHPARY